MPGVERDVIYNVKVKVDPAAAGAMGQLAAELKKTTEQAAASAATTDGVTQRLAASFLAEVQALREGEAALQQKTEAMKHFGKVSADVQAAAKQSQQDDSGRSQAVLSSLNKLTAGIMDGARAWAIYGASSEKELERNIRTLAKLESGIRAAHGGLQGIEGAGGLIAAARGGSGAEIQAASAAAGVVGVTALAGLAVVIGGLSLVSKDFREGLMELVGWTDKAGDSLKAFNETVAKRQQADETEAKRLGIENRFQERVSASSLRAGLAIADTPQQQLQVEREHVGLGAAQNQMFVANQNRSAPEYESRRASALANIASAFDRQQTVLEKELDQARKGHSAALDFENKRLGLIQDQLKATNAQIDAEKQKLMSQEERLANLDPFTAQATAEAARTAKRGGQLNTEQANLLGGFTGFEGARQDAFRRQVDSSGLSFILDQQRQAIAAQERAAANQQIKVEGQFEYIIRVDQDNRNLIQSLKQAVDEAREDTARAMAAQTAAEKLRFQGNAAAQAAQKSR